jgi:glutathione S-transferase
MSITLYGNPKTRAFRAIWALTEADLPFELVKLDMTKGEHKSEAFLKINPNAKVPALVDEGKALYESAAICIHIAEKKPEKKLMPKAGTFERSLVNQWLSFCLSELEAHLWLIAKHTFILPEAERNLASVKPFALSEFNKSMKTVEMQLAKSDYLVANQFTVADIMIAQTLFWAQQVEGTNINQPQVQAYLQRCKGRPGYPNIKNYL